ncbi:molybdenum cofactor guanylyltransferase MobA [Sulfurimonas paralvinellae]|uniref:Probable molybdenum cofactor guanylyltransferase n=1 Tax=Sulfurimonas paralvinellae TaxID=317658 RepID=A0A7M1BA54_9BACT|nr:molybdenum cofactor guanylyltransferase MobA [Sulfurimonas paralvinellae]QOP46600.1 molybdenum cofactor guanylyltransferase MobA [Sulfurimonas paralvinellae]
MFDIPCVIFAGGKSSRMGEDKALLPFASYKTLTEYQYTRLSKFFTNVYISCKNSKNFDFSAQFIEDNKAVKLFAPTAGFLAAFKTLNTDAFFALSVDAPFVDEIIISKLIHADDPAVDATIARTPEGLQPLCGIYHRSLENEFQKMLEEENHKLGYLLKNAHTNTITFHDTTPFLNMNHPDDYKKALQLLKTSNY